MRSVRLHLCFFIFLAPEVDLKSMESMSVSIIFIQVETTSDDKVAKTLVFANSKSKSLAHFKLGKIMWIVMLSCRFPQRMDFNPKVVDEGNPSNIFLFQVCECLWKIYNDSDRKRSSCRALGTSEKKPVSNVFSTLLFVGTKDYCRCNHLAALWCADQEIPFFWLKMRNHKGWIDPLFWGFITLRFGLHKLECWDL